MDVRALPVLGRPRGLSIFAAACLPKISGKTSRALRAREKVSYVQTGLSRSARAGLRLRFIPLTSRLLALRRLIMCVFRDRGVNTKTRSRSPRVCNDQRAVPFKFKRLRKRDPSRCNVPGVFYGIEADGLR